MMNLTFYTNKNEINSIEVSEDCYKKLAEAGLENLADFNDIKIQIDGEEYEISATELIEESRKKFISFIEMERQKELEILFANMDDNPTIKEIRKEFSYVKYLTEIYRQFSCQDNIYFSYD